MSHSDRALDARLRALEHQVRAAPEDLDGWLELAHLASRSDAALEVLGRDRHLPGLLAAWRRVPGDPTLAELVLRLLGLQLEPLEPASAPPLWQQGRRLGGEAPYLRDQVSGLPLRCRRRLDGGVMVLVPEGEVPGMRRNRVAHGDSHGAYRVASFLIDPAPLTTPLTWHQAQAEAHRLGGRLPSDDELRAARGGVTDARGAGPYGVRGLGFDHAEWTATVQLHVDGAWEARDLARPEEMEAAAALASRAPLVMTTAGYRPPEERLVFRVLLPLTLAREASPIG